MDTTSVLPLTKLFNELTPEEKQFILNKRVTEIKNKYYPEEKYILSNLDSSRYYWGIGILKRLPETTSFKSNVKRFFVACIGTLPKDHELVFRVSVGNQYDENSHRFDGSVTDEIFEIIFEPIDQSLLINIQSKKKTKT